MYSIYMEHFGSLILAIVNENSKSILLNDSEEQRQAVKEIAERLLPLNDKGCDNDPEY